MYICTHIFILRNRMHRNNIYIYIIIYTYVDTTEYIYTRKIQ